MVIQTAPSDIGKWNKDLYFTGGISALFPAGFRQKKERLLPESIVTVCHTQCVMDVSVYGKSCAYQSDSAIVNHGVCTAGGLDYTGDSGIGYIFSIQYHEGILSYHIAGVVWTYGNCD